MRPLDWAVLAAWLLFTLIFGLYRARGSGTMRQYLLAGKTMPWYAMALSIMATQASAITFISTTGQSYVDGMRFVQFYFGLPVAMIVLSATAVPIFHRANVYTAYEYLEQRFDLKTRTLVGFVFLIQRGLAAGLTIYAPAVVLSVILGWSDNITTICMGAVVILYTTLGGVKAITWSDVQQMILIFAALLLALGIAIYLLPRQVSFADALTIAGAAGRINPVVTRFDWNDRYNLFSGLIGGMFLALAYFGCDQSQVQRYLTGKSIAQSRLSLLFNAMAKIPMQFFILFIGAMVFVVFHFEKPPLLFQPASMKRVEARPSYPPLAQKFDQAFDNRKAAALDLVAATHASDPASLAAAKQRYANAQKDLDGVRKEGAKLAVEAGDRGFNDTNYIFLSFVLRYLPPGIVGLIIAVIFGAAMSTVSGEINSLATVTVIDVYKRHLNKDATDRQYLWASRAFTAFWGVYAVVSASFAKTLGSLIEAVNILGSLFYGGMLGVFVLAFFFPKVKGAGAFYGVIAGEAAIFAAYLFTGISFLWYNVIGCVVVILSALLITQLQRDRIG